MYNFLILWLFSKLHRSTLSPFSLQEIFKTHLHTVKLAHHSLHSFMRNSKEFTYLFNNSICDYNTTNNKCLNIEEKEYKNNKSKYNSNYIVNNCGISGFYEPINEGPCKNIQLVEGLCCFVEYGNGKDNHTACLRTSESEKEKAESYFKNYNYTENFNFIDAKCKEKYIELWLSILFVSLLFLI